MLERRDWARYHECILLRYACFLSNNMSCPLLFLVGWEHTYGPFSEYADENGVSADEACCECMTTESRHYAIQGCTHNYEIQWRDKFGYTCESYVRNIWCDSGDYGSGKISTS